MPIRSFSVAALPGMPWKNGGGVTREIACHPERAGLGDFDWRVSIAAIAAGGPFSAFAGIDRVITLLEGEGVRLRSADGAVDHRLTMPLAPFAFSGDVPVDAQLLGGPCEDLNVMTRRGVCRARVEVVRSGRALPVAAGGVLLAVRGAWLAGAANGRTFALEPGAGLTWHEAPTAWEASVRAEPFDRLRANGMEAALVAVLIEREDTP